MATKNPKLESDSSVRSQLKRESLRRTVKALEAAVQEERLVVLRPATPSGRRPGEVRISRRSTPRA